MIGQRKTAPVVYVRRDALNTLEIMIDEKQILLGAFPLDSGKKLLGKFPWPSFDSCEMLRSQISLDFSLLLLTNRLICFAIICFMRQNSNY